MMMFKIAKKIPKGFPTVLFILIILYASLDPNPIGSKQLMLFASADKVVHFMMYFFLTIIAIGDYALAIYPRHTRINAELGITAAAITFGGLVEVLQQTMGLGRGMSTGDFIADAAGAVVAFALMKFLFLPKCRHFIKKRNRKPQPTT